MQLLGKGALPVHLAEQEIVGTELSVIRTDRRRLTMAIRRHKGVVRRFRRCANVLECTYTNLDSIANCTPGYMVQGC